MSAERHFTGEGAANSCAVMNLGFDKGLTHQTHLEKPREDRQGLAGCNWCEQGESIEREDASC